MDVRIKRQMREYEHAPPYRRFRELFGQPLDLFRSETIPLLAKRVERMQEEATDVRIGKILVIPELVVAGI